jgi:Tfp pilus assembly protein PilF
MTPPKYSSNNGQPPEPPQSRSGAIRDFGAALDDAAHFLIDNKPQRADRILRKLLKADPDNAEALHLSGVARHREGKAKQARDLVEHAIRVQSDVAMYHVTLGGIFDGMDETAKAAASYECAVLLDPMDAETYFALANAWRRLGHLEAAIDCYERTLDIVPNDAPTLYNLGNVLKTAGRLEEAVDAYRLALASQPGFVTVYKNLGTALKELGRTAEAFDILRTGARIMFAPEALSEDELRYPLMTSDAKLQHDAEQIDYLIGHGKISRDQARFAAIYRGLIDGAAAPRAPTASFQMPSDVRDSVAHAYNRLIYLGDAPRSAASAINSELDAGAIEQDYHASRPEITFFDNFLTPDALQRLRAFCLESTIWYARYENGYLGAMLGDGFANPLLAQIVDELPQALPGIFGDHKLNQAWAFKYDSRLSGINMHADFAAVNVNFWITPDDALEDEEAGGLVVWDKEAPLDWDFEKYNTDDAAMRQFLKENDAKAVRVPYRQNRALVFNSDLFHETDRITFRPGYENRRINITLLYGDRKTA